MEKGKGKREKALQVAGRAAIGSATYCLLSVYCTASGLAIVLMMVDGPSYTSSPAVSKVQKCLLTAPTQAAVQHLLGIR